MKRTIKYFNKELDRELGRLAHGLLMAVVVIIVGGYLMMTGYFFVSTQSLGSMLLIGVVSYVFISLVLPRLLQVILPRQKHPEIRSWGLRGLGRVNNIFIVLAVLVTKFQFVSAHLTKITGAPSTEDLVVIVIPWLSSFLYVLYLVVVEQRKKSSIRKFSIKGRSLTPEQLIAEMERHQSSKD